MILSKKRWRFIPVREHWFEFAPSRLDYVALSVFFRVPSTVNKPTGLLSFTGRTIQIDLSKDKEQIWRGFSKQTRNYIRQAERLQLRVDFNCSMDEFVAFYNRFATKKKISRLSTEDFNNLPSGYLLTKISIGGTAVAMHFYLMDQATGQVQLFRSASARDFLQTPDKNEIGKANKFMHFKTIEHFQNAGFLVYDFGGYSLPTDNDFRKFTGVNQFKKNFGGEEVVYRNFASPAYYFLKKLSDSFTRLRK